MWSGLKVVEALARGAGEWNGRISACLSGRRGLPVARCVPRYLTLAACPSGQPRYGHSSTTGFPHRSATVLRSSNPHPFSSTRPRCRSTPHPFAALRLPLPARPTHPARRPVTGRIVSMPPFPSASPVYKPCPALPWPPAALLLAAPTWDRNSQSQMSPIWMSMCLPDTSPHLQGREGQHGGG